MTTSVPLATWPISRAICRVRAASRKHRGKVRVARVHGAGESFQDSHLGLAPVRVHRAGNLIPLPDLEPAPIDRDHDDLGHHPLGVGHRLPLHQRAATEALDRRVALRQALVAYSLGQSLHWLGIQPQLGQLLQIPRRLDERRALGTRGDDLLWHGRASLAALRR
jgi:hypothetical protein